MPIDFGADCRPLFSIESDLIFLNNGSFGAPPHSMLEAQATYRAMAERSPISFFRNKLPKYLREAAGDLGAFIGAAEGTLAFTENATTGINSVVLAVAHSLRPGDILLTTDHVYGAVRQTLNRYAEWTGAKVVEVSVPFPLHDSNEITEVIAAALTSQVKFAVFDHITSPSGIIFPIQDIVNLCRERNIPVLVDGAHAPGMVELNIEHLGADWYVGNCHKWMFAPKGCAFLYTAPERQKETHALITSHGYGKGYAAEFDFTGTKDYSAFLAVRDALKFYRENGGLEKIAAYNRNLARSMRRMLAETWNVAPPAPESAIGSLAALPVPENLPANEETGWALHDELFGLHRIEVPVTFLKGRLWVRISAQIFNESNEYCALAEALPKAIISVQCRL